MGSGYRWDKEKVMLSSWNFPAPHSSDSLKKHCAVSDTTNPEAVFISHRYQKKQNDNKLISSWIYEDIISDSNYKNTLRMQLKVKLWTSISRPSFVWNLLLSPWGGMQVGWTEVPSNSRNNNSKWERIPWNEVLDGKSQRWCGACVLT